MRIFLDTSSLFKLYHHEAGSEEIEQIFIQNAIQTVFLSEITKLEFASTVWKKVRTKELADEQARELIQAFESDFPNYAFVQFWTLDGFPRQSEKVH
ncbi:MAG: type II toxin-antitoxin system VapC family toxin [Saprospiraceae bacterium]